MVDFLFLTNKVKFRVAGLKQENKFLTFDPYTDARLFVVDIRL